MKYIALLRGINVGGRVIKMADLSVCFIDMGFDGVRTLLQSGNIIFESQENDPKILKQRIEAGLTKTFNYPAKVWVLNIKDIEKIVEGNPFNTASSDYHQYVIFFERDLVKEFVNEAENLGDEEIKTGENRIVYWKVQKGMTLKSKVGKLTAKTKYKDFNTTRNINTLRKV